MKSVSKSDKLLLKGGQGVRPILSSQETHQETLLFSWCRIQEFVKGLHQLCVRPCPGNLMGQREE